MDAAKESFHAVAIANNKKGYDAQILKMFKEPSWNNPVVRFIKADKSDIVEKIKRNWTSKNLVNTMITVLKTEKRPVPAYLSLLNKDLAGFKKPEELSEVSKSIYKHLPMGYAQSQAVEGALKKKEDPKGFLSPSQIIYLNAIKKDSSKNWPVLAGVELIKAWNEFSTFYTHEVEAI